MTSDERARTRILGTLRSAHGQGVVAMEDRYDNDVDDVWSALTDPRRLACWFSEVEGDPRLAGEYRERVFASGWEGTVRVEAYEPPRRLGLTRTSDQAKVPVIGVEATLAVDGDHKTVVGIEVRGIPLDLLAAYGSGWQVHVEDLAAHLAGRPRGDAEARWDELTPAYEELAATLG